MPAFLSYSREDLELADRVSRQLGDAGVTVWRDQEQLYGGQRWPKALGEAIAASDALVLLWSRHAAKSAFVELEWCTALALRRKVIPCLLDDTPLPASLAAIEAVHPARIAAPVGGLSGAPADETKSSDKSHVQEVVRQLGEIDDGKPSEVLRKAKAGRRGSPRCGYFDGP